MDAPVDRRPEAGSSCGPAACCPAGKAARDARCGDYPMRIEAVRPFDRDDLLTVLRATRLRGFGAPLVYGAASLEIASMDTSALAPAQRYVLKPGVRQALELREALL